MKDCCEAKESGGQCIRKKDGKVFTLPRRFSRKRCTEGKISGFTMRSSCAPYSGCKSKRRKNRKTKRRRVK